MKRLLRRGARFAPGLVLLLQLGACGPRDWCHDVKTAPVHGVATPTWSFSSPFGVEDIWVAPDGDIAATGSMLGRVSVSLLDPQGKKRWDAMLGPPSQKVDPAIRSTERLEEWGTAIAGDAQMNLVVVGRRRQELLTDAGWRTTESLVVYGLDSAGHARWAKSWPGIEHDGTVVVKPSGEAFVASGGHDLRIHDVAIDGGFLMALDSAGEVKWTLPLGPHTRRARVAMGADGQLFVAWSGAEPRTVFVGRVDQGGRLLESRAIETRTVDPPLDAFTVDSKGGATFLSVREVSDLVSVDARGGLLFEQEGGDELVLDVNRAPNGSGWLVAGRDAGLGDACGARRGGGGASGFVAELGENGALGAIRWLPERTLVRHAVSAPDGSIVIAGVRVDGPPEPFGVSQHRVDPRWLGFGAPRPSGLSPDLRSVDGHGRFSRCQEIRVPVYQEFVAKLPRR